MRLWRGPLVALLLTTVMAVLPVALGVAAADDPATVLQRFTDARNRGDVAGAIALLADNVRFVEGPTCSPDNPCIGPAAARPFLEHSIPLHILLTATGTPLVSGMTVRQRFEVRGDPFTVGGIERFVGNTTVEVRDGKIASYLNVPDTSDAQTARYLASPPPPQGPPPAQGLLPTPLRTGGGSEASFIYRLGDG